MEGVGQQMPNVILGVAQDSLSAKGIASATTAIYLEKDNSLLHYGFTSNTGAFKFQSLPLNSSLILVITHIGYQPYRYKFALTSERSTIDLKQVFISPKSNKLDEVEISSQQPPVVMRGDTLEISADAFKTKENAVVEDLLQKVPGIVVWADGKISVNGKTVTQLYVDGKPFFRGDPVNAIRNLPKNIVDKVKVYDDKAEIDQFNDDPTVIMDIQLKKGKNRGVFGKVGGAFGTDERYDGDISFNVFSPKDQISLLYAMNNINKEILSMERMRRQTVFKPGGNDNTEYQPNFSMEGLNKFRSGGVSYDRDWSKYMRTTAEYFNSNVTNQTGRAINTITYLAEGLLNGQSRDDIYSRTEQQHLNTSLKEKKAGYEITIEPDLDREKRTLSTKNSIQVSDENKRLLSRNESNRETEAIKNKLNLKGEYINKDSKYDVQRFRFLYHLVLDDFDDSEKVALNFTDLTDPKEQRINVNRKKNLSKKIIDNYLFGELDVNEVMNWHSKLKFKFVNTAIHRNEDMSQRVNYFNDSNGLYSVIDPYLTNNSNYTLLQEKPGIEIGRNNHTSDARNHRNFSWAILLETQFSKQDNRSDKSFQRINRNYVVPLPSLNLMYNHQLHGRFNKTYFLNYITKFDIPTIDRLVPLIDSINPYYTYIGNANLKGQYTNELRFRYHNVRAHNKGTLRFDARLGLISNQFADSSIYDKAGRQIVYTSNVNKSQYMKLTFSYEKSTKIFSNPINFGFYPNVNLSRNPYFINEEERQTRNLQLSFLGLANYVCNDLLLFNFDSNILYFKNVIRGSTGQNTLQTTMINNALSVQLSWPKGVTFANSFGHSLQTGTYNQRVENFIWNIKFYYRMLKKEQLELKFTALDVLGQRNNVIRRLDNNVLNFGTVNNLQRIFMVGIAYYPRYFGSKESRTGHK